MDRETKVRENFLAKLNSDLVYRVQQDSLNNYPISDSDFDMAKP